MRYYIDIETGPLPDSVLESICPPVHVPDLGPFDPGSVATGNMKDAAKIAEKIAAAQQAHEAAVASLPATRAAKQAEALASLKSGAALNALQGRVDLIVINNDGTFVDFGHDDEAELLSAFWSEMSGFSTDDQLVGFNVRIFDMPFIIRRSLINRVKVPRFLKADMMQFRPRHLIDLRDHWQLGDRQAPGSLAAICAAFGIQVKSNPEVSGKNFHQAWISGQRAECIEYCHEDVQACVLLADLFDI